MRSKRPKVLHEICGAPLVGHVVDAVSALEPSETIAVLGNLREEVEAWLKANHPKVKSVIQEEQLGTGHAVKVALSELAEASGKVLIAPADMPLITSEDLANLALAAADKAGAVLTAEVEVPSGYGRVLSKNDLVLAIVEDKDADDKTLKITEINTGIYIFEIDKLKAALASLKQDNKQNEFYLTDIVAILNQQGEKVAKTKCLKAENALGVNDRQQLAQAGAIMQKRINNFWMSSGVSMRNPSNVFIDKTAYLESDCYLDNNTFILSSDNS